MNNKTCCFFGHRKIDDTEILRTKLYETIESLILNEKTDTFLLGSKSEFNELCHAVLTELKEKYPYIRRIYVRAEFPYIDESYREYLLKRYEDTYFPEHAINAGHAVYVERNYEMIDKSHICIIYYTEKFFNDLSQ